MIQQFWRRHFTAAIVALALSAGSVTSAVAAERRDIWSSRDQFVAIEPREKLAGAMAANAHPAEIKQESLVVLLEAIRLRPSADSNTTPLFTNESLQILAHYLSQGLRQASPAEEVTFAVIGLHSALYGLTRQPMVTTGRVFVSDGRIHLIIGLAQQEVNEKVDRRLAPFTPGSRQQQSGGAWLLQLPAEPPGLTLLRRDWLAAELNWQPVGRIESLSSPPAPPQSPPGSTRNPAERLSVLKELQEKGLITDEEYRAKRLEILKGL